MSSELLLGAQANKDAIIGRTTVEDFRRMIDAGKISEDEPVELLDGEIVKKMTKHPPHILAIKRLIRIIPNRLPNGWHSQFQDSILLGESMPEPDVVVIRGLPDDYRDRLAEAKDSGLVIEVADSTLARDRDKAAMYARNGIPHYWILNLAAECLECYSQPITDEGEICYKTVQVFHPDQTVPLVLDEETVTQLSVADMLP